MRFPEVMQLWRRRDAGALVPEALKAALDAVADGLVVLDLSQRIAHANAAFAEAVGRERAGLIGAPIGDVEWRGPGMARGPRLPWDQVFEQRAQAGPCRLTVAGEPPGPRGARTFLVRCAPLLGARGRLLGALVTFAEETELREKSQQLEQTLASLEQLRNEVRSQQEELTHLSTRDLLTGVLNRRAFLEQAQAEFDVAAHDDRPLACVMADIDGLRAINEHHGEHAADEVIQKTAQSLAGLLRASDLICRYGGQEFCVLLPGASIDEAEETAERLRRSLESQSDGVHAATASFGAASLSLGGSTLSQLIEQAAYACDASKRRGRNCVTRWDWTDGYAPEGSGGHSD